MNSGYLKRSIKKIINKNYRLSRAMYHFQLHLREMHLLQSPIVIFQMGKVGSSTIKRSLDKYSLNRPVYQIHYLSPYYLETNEQRFRKIYRDVHPNHPAHHWESQYLKRQMRKKADQKWHIITLVREPVGRNVSSFFQNLTVEKNDEIDWYKVRSLYGFEIGLALNDVDILLGLFLEKFDHDTPLIFYDREFKGVLDIDVFAKPFPQSKGYEIYEEPSARVLLLKLEKLNECAVSAFHEFLGIEDFQLRPANLSESKAYYELYRNFLKNARLPQAYIDEMYESKYARHFYSPAEIKEFRARWEILQEPANSPEFLETNTIFNQKGYRKIWKPPLS